MSPDDITPAPVEVDGLGEGFSAEEQAQWNAMQAGSDVEIPEPSAAPAIDPPSEPATPAAKTEAPAAAPSDDDDIEVAAPVTGAKQKRVSIHKYQRLEERAKQAEERAEAAAKERQELLERTARADERLKIISEAMATPPAQEQQQIDEDPMPDPEKDIFGYAQWQGRQIVRLNDRLNGIETRTVETVEETQLATTYQQDAARFASTPEGAGFADAYVYLIQQRDRELQLAGMSDPKQRERQIVSEEKGLVKGAIAQGRSPAQLIYEMAAGRGFAPRAAAAPAAAPAAPSTPAKDPRALDVAAPPRAAAPAATPAAPSVSAEIEAIKRGQQAAQSLSNVGGGAPPQELTSKVLADMNEEEFNALVDRLPKERLMQLMGN